MKHQSLVQHCQRTLCRHRIQSPTVVLLLQNDNSASLSLPPRRRRQQHQQQQQQQQTQRRFYRYTRRKNNDQFDDTMATTTTAIIKNISSTIPRMGQGVQVGQYATMTRTYTSEDVDSFGRLIQDFNPLHSSSNNKNIWQDEIETGNNDNNDDDDDEDNILKLQKAALEAAGLIQFQNDDGTTGTTTKALVHGIFVSGIFSSIFANLAPGCVYMNQGLDFCSPVFVNDIVVGCIQIQKIRRWRKGGIVVQCHTRVYKLHNNNDANNSDHGVCYQQPVQAQLSVKGRANVWLPIGYKRALIKE